VTDIARVAEIAHRHGIPLIVDNTVASPFLLRPIEHGADIVVHSLTKYLGGHGTSIGGAIVDSGKFPWAEHKARFKRLNEPDVSYHGVVYTEAFGPAAYIGRARVVPLRNMGAAISPFNAFLILQGIETLALRMERITENTIKVAQFLQKHAKVAWVNYAGLPEHPDHALAQKYLGGKPSGLLTFGVKAADGKRREAGAAFLDALQVFTRLVNIDDAKSLATHPASTASSRPKNSSRRACPKTPCVCRLALSTSTTCWPTWTGHWPPHELPTTALGPRSRALRLQPDRGGLHPVHLATRREPANPRARRRAGGGHFCACRQAPHWPDAPRRGAAAHRRAAAVGR
jgi:O-acetylhomoserine (thiol)-lyase